MVPGHAAHRYAGAVVVRIDEVIPVSVKVSGRGGFNRIAGIGTCIYGIRAPDDKVCSVDVAVPAVHKV